MSTSRLMLKGSALQTLDAVVAIVVGMITLPLMQKSLGSELYGVWILVGGFTAFLYIFDFGFAASIIQGVASSVAAKDSKKTNSIINTAFCIYTILSISILLLVTVLSLTYKPEISNVISGIELSWIIFIVGLSIAIEFPFKALAGLPQAYLRFDKGAINRIIVKLVGLVGTIILLHCGFKLVPIALWSLAMSIFSNLLFLSVAKAVFSELRLSRKYIDINLARHLFKYSSWSFLIDINNLIKKRVDVFFVAGYISLGAVSVYYVSVRLVEYAVQLLFKGLNLGLPILTANASQNENGKFSENLQILNRVNVYFSVIAFLFFYIFGRSVIYYWMGSEFDFGTAYEVLIVLLCGRLAALCCNGFATALYAKALHRFFAYLNLCETFFTVVMLYISLAVFQMGVIGVALSVSIPIFISRMVVVPILSVKVMELKNIISLFWLSYRPLLLVVVIIPLSLVWPMEPQLGINHLIMCLIGILVFLGFVYLDLQENERKLLGMLINIRK